MNSLRNAAKKGFTLVELAIVVVIIGLIIGGVVVGNDLVNASRLNSVIDDFSRYQSSIASFKLKYDAMPGDMSEASLNWSGAANGDNDGQFDFSETYEVWNHLGRSGITPPYTSSVWNSPGHSNEFFPVVDAGTNYPRSRACPRCGWTALYSDFLADQLNYAGIAAVLQDKNRLIFGDTNPTSVDINVLSGTSGYGAGQIDIKMDNGFPHTGMVLAGHGWKKTSGGGAADNSNSCISGSGAAATYDRTASQNACAMAFTLDIDEQ